MCHIIYIISFDPHYITTLWSRSCSSHFMAENTEAQRDEWTFPRSHSWCAGGQNWKTNVWQKSQLTQRFSMRRDASFIAEAVRALKWLLNSLASRAATAEWVGPRRMLTWTTGMGMWYLDFIRSARGGKRGAVPVKEQKCPSPKDGIMHKPSTADKFNVWRDPVMGNRTWGQGRGDQTPRNRAPLLQASLYESRES